jgi:asparagine synthase (glutamine-hydrolysing)
MCGILGAVFVSDGTIIDRVPAALNLIAHRGPDGEGFWSDGIATLAHRRLAIIDLGEGGRQPMEDMDSGLVLICNGELYNYIELRADLEQQGVRFVTQSDTEVVLKALRHWGTAAFSRFNGMWGLALWDPKNRALLLARDRFGVKPLYYAKCATGLVFASEPKALLRLDPGLAEPDVAALQRLIVSSSAFGGRDTFFRRIKSVPAGCYAIVTEGQAAVEPVSYWAYPEFDQSAGSYSRKHAADEFQSIFESAVALRLRSDVPVGATISGGLDSSAIVNAAGRQGHKLSSYTAVYGQNRGEERWAKICSNLAGIKLDSVEVSFSDWLSTLKKITWHMDAPGFSPPVFPSWKIFERARADAVPVLLEGQGADELLGGYVHHAAAHVWDVVRRLKLAQAAQDVSGLSETFGWPLLSRWLVRSPVDRQYTAWQMKFGRGRLLAFSGEDQGAHQAANPSNIFEALHRDHSVAVLPSLLQYGDAVSMAHGIECRHPFLDFRLVEWVFRNHPDVLVNGQTKAPIRTYLRRTGFGRIADRRDKKGFTTPTASWFVDNRRALGELVFDNPNAELWQYVDYRAYRKLRPSMETDFTASHTYKLLTTQLWLSNTRELADHRSDFTRSIDRGRESGNWKL